MEKPRSHVHLSRLKKGKLAKESQTKRIATRRFIAESCEIAKRLPYRNRLLFLMRFESGFSTKEIANLCQVDETTVCRRIKQIADEIDAMRKSAIIPSENGDE